MFGADELRQGVNRNGAADNRVGALRAEPGNLVAPFLFRCCEAVDDVPQTIDRELIAVQLADGISARRAIDFGQIAQRASGADESIP